MKYFIKLFALTALAGAYVYTFFVQPEISSYGFSYWMLSISLLLVTVGNYASLIAACNTKNDDETEKGFLILSSFLSFLIFASIFFFTIYRGDTDWSYLLCCFVAYMFSSGFNKRTWSFIFLGFSQTLFFCLNCIPMNTWHSWGLFVLFTIMHIICIVVVINDYIESDPVPKTELIGLLIPVAVICYIGAINYEFLVYDLNSVFLLCYLIVALFASMRDDTTTYLSISMLSVVYLFFLPDHYFNFVILLLGCSILLTGISYYRYKSRMAAILTYTIDENKRIIAEYNNLVEKYNQAIDYINNTSTQSNSSSKGNEASLFNGFKSGIGTFMGKQFAEYGLDWILSSLGLK